MTKWRIWDGISADVVGALSLTGLLLPESIAYSGIAGLPPAYGVTAGVLGPLAYSILGRSRLAVVSATSASAALLAAAVANVGIRDVSRADCAVALTVLVGLFFILGAIFRLAPLTSFVSRAVLRGFAFGIAITICIRQLPKLLGVSVNQDAPLQVLVTIFANIGTIHWPSAMLGAGALLFLLVSRRLKFVASGLLLIIAVIVGMHFGPSDHFGIAATGTIEVQLASFRIPTMATRDWEMLAQLAFPIALVLLAESWATIRSLAVARADAISPEREIVALGLANLASGILRGLPVGAGFSIGNANAQAGTSTRLGAMIAAALVAVLAFAASNWIALIPEPVLAAIVITALVHALSPKPIFDLFNLGRDGLVAVSAAAGVLVFGIVNGLLIAIGLSLAGLLRRLAYPRLSELGRLGVHDFVDCATHQDAKPVPEMLVIRVNAPLFFANAEPTLSAIAKRARSAEARSIVLSLEETDDLDSSALEAIADFNESIILQGRSLILARVHDRVRLLLERGGLSQLAATAAFSVDDAVRALGGD